MSIDTLQAPQTPEADLTPAAGIMRPDVNEADLASDIYSSNVRSIEDAKSFTKPVPSGVGFDIASNPEQTEIDQPLVGQSTLELSLAERRKAAKARFKLHGGPYRQTDFRESTFARTSLNIAANI